MTAPTNGLPPQRVRAAAATRIGVSLADYDRRRAAGEKWCTGCKRWQPVAEFGSDSSRADGLAKWCRQFTNQRYQEEARQRAEERSDAR